MNSVTQRRVKRLGQHNKGMGKEGLVLFCCILFCAVQLLIAFDFSAHANLNKEHLVVLPKQNIALKVIHHPETTQDGGDFDLSGSQQFSPFFFQPVAINYCDKSLLMSIRGIGPRLAERILQTRKKIGYFSAPEDLLQVKGIGKTRLLQFAQLLSFSYDPE